MGGPGHGDAAEEQHADVPLPAVLPSDGAAASDHRAADQRGPDARAAGHGHEVDGGWRQE